MREGGEKDFDKQKSERPDGIKKRKRSYKLSRLYAAVGKCRAPL